MEACKEPDLCSAVPGTPQTQPGLLDLPVALQPCQGALIDASLIVPNY